MTHEFKLIIEAYIKAKTNATNCALATLVAVNGSSYRKEGVRMLIHENGQVVGAISGGCVEKEIICQAQSVFTSGKSKLITYDGRYRLGCEGTLYILIEKLNIDAFALQKIQLALKQRIFFALKTYYVNSTSSAGFSVFCLEGKEYAISSKSAIDTKHRFFYQKMPALFQLYIIGTEHDASSLSQQASFLGWQVTIINATKIEKHKESFLGANQLLHFASAKNLDSLLLDTQTAVVLMNHNYAKDLWFLQKLKHAKVAYIGLLGAKKRREQLMNALLEEDLDLSEDFLTLIHGPTGVNIGAITPQEIAVSIVAEILSAIRNKQLSNKLSSNVIVG